MSQGSTRQSPEASASARRKLVVLGNGMAAGRVLDELFARASDKYAVTIFGAEPRVNYDRIMLSPVLAGEKEFDAIIVHDDAWYARHNVDLRKGETVVAIDRAARSVRTQSGTVEHYEQTHEGGTDHDWVDAWMARQLGSVPKPRLWEVA